MIALKEVEHQTTLSLGKKKKKPGKNYFSFSDYLYLYPVMSPFLNSDPLRMRKLKQRDKWLVEIHKKGWLQNQDINLRGQLPVLNYITHRTKFDIGEFDVLTKGRSVTSQENTVLKFYSPQGKETFKFMLKSLW